VSRYHLRGGVLPTLYSNLVAEIEKVYKKKKRNCFRTHHFVTHQFSSVLCWSVTLVCAKTFFFLKKRPFSISATRLLMPRFWRAAATPACSLAQNRGHSKECLTAQRKFTAQRKLTAQRKFVAYHSNSVAQHNFVAWSRYLKILVSLLQE